tara:strand:+ start:326 stop:1606 length:1281 start_codon:yes stop_codon:yes gene_type:complete
MIPFLMVSLSFSQFLKETDFEYLASQPSINDINTEDFGFSYEDNIPSSFSIEKYAIVADQTGSSCVGFAVANGALTIVYNMVNNITNFDEKWINRFDPYYVYSAINDPDRSCNVNEDCGCGTHIYEALNLIKQYGAKKVFISPKLDCQDILFLSDLRELFPITGYYSIDDYVSLCDYKKINNQWDVDVHIDWIKSWLSNGNPIIAGIDVGDNFNDISSYSPLYSSRQGDKAGHAVTIVGYDNYKYGGAFRILNSYGTDWGDNGYFWMTYTDFEKNCSKAFAMTHNDFSEWKNSISDKNFYKGKSKSGKLHWEGPLDNDRNFDGRGIIKTKDYIAGAGYKNGQRHGWWVFLNNNNVNDPFRGWVLYQDGEYIEKESFGFSSSNTQSVDALKEGFQFNHIDLQLSNELMTEEELHPSITSKSELENVK